eukprot:GHRR01015841.1.p1 GENE.GHRR01015841.1~~GHRR01015841.1.p1  ORF type:complete len:100 (-),score=17.21 GHRR01015841.1:331-630(-)
MASGRQQSLFVSCNRGCSTLQEMKKFIHVLLSPLQLPGAGVVKAMKHCCTALLRHKVARWQRAPPHTRKHICMFVCMLLDLIANHCSLDDLVTAVINTR